MRSSLTHLPYVFGIAIVAGCPAKSEENPTTTAETSGEGSSSGGTTQTTTTATTAPSEESTSDTPEESSSSGGAEVTTGETGDPECGPGIDCGIAAPDGWFGPMIISRSSGSDEVPACPEGYEEGPVVLEGFIDPGPAVCECECESAGANCTAYAYTHANASCNTYTYTNVTETCTNLAGPFQYAQFYMYANGVGSCTASTVETFAPAQWESTIHSCKLAEGAQSCNGDGVCQPIPPGDFEATACIYQQGDVGCPAGAYNTKHLYSTGVDDTRDCGTCTCASPAQSCNGNMMVFDEADCAGEPSSLVASGGSCASAPGTAIAFDLGADGGCPVANQPQPQGSVAPVGAFTFCCQGS